MITSIYAHINLILIIVNLVDIPKKFNSAVNSFLHLYTCVVRVTILTSYL